MNRSLLFQSFRQVTDLDKEVPLSSPAVIEKTVIDGVEYVDVTGQGLSGSIAAAFACKRKDEKTWVPAARYDELMKLMSEIEDELKFKEATLYHNIMYTVVPKDHDLKLGILPEDQGFSKKYVFLWDSYAYLNIFDDTTWKKVLVHIPDEAKHNMLTRLTGAAFAIPGISNTWELQEQPTEPQYTE